MQYQAVQSILIRSIRSDSLLDSFLVQMFGSRDAAFFIEALLKVRARDVYLVWNVPGWPRALMVSQPSVGDNRYVAVVKNQTLWILDYVSSSPNSVVPQEMWIPPNHSDWRPYVEQAHLCMPIFFLQHNGTIGLPLPRATVGDTECLRGANLTAPLGGAHYTHIRIAVSSLPLPSLLCLSPARRIVASQWPG
jgi:hypothetical protein